jgi:hypothetical protein
MINWCLQKPEGYKNKKHLQNELKVLDFTSGPTWAQTILLH